MSARRMAYEAAMAAVSLLLVALVFLSDQDGVGLLAGGTLYVLDGILIAVSLGDWFHGLREASSRRHYVATTVAELPGLIPLAFGGAGPLRFLRLLRVVRVGRAVGRTHKVLAGHDAPRWLLHVHVMGWAATGVVLLGALMVWIAERGANEEFASYGDAVWWAVVTVTQVGYGDITPTTTTGRTLSAVLMVAGIGLFAVLISVVSRALVVHHIGAEPDGGEEAEDEEGRGAHLVDRLAELSRLHKEGGLDDEEFRQAKRLLLAPAEEGRGPRPSAAGGRRIRL